MNLYTITGKNYYSQVFLEECNYVVQEKKMPEYITDDFHREESDEGNTNKENYIATLTFQKKLCY